ncbi:hypothetical protein GTA08_BOTSDO09527 [Neofusicoccum parvum]|uniref:cutinase n=2 Tax=Neofusicoccum parvum TaxID=310453 RepID=R1EW06_BOTPV|nr:putative cutinase protein [Neofusicoccum parvum UCRNP2]GME34328.1 hypothetical protein GTA08_BOTSDO09527 [Neofusicoccum parvum]GME35269.1 hypothetical protein GTA08_BOTSDO09527 [Neofusicoccum parvum]
MVALNYCTMLAIIAAASAAPLEARAPQGFSIPGMGGSSTANDVQSGVCKPVTYIFARGTTEGGNMGQTVGPALKQKLEAAIGADKLATQGVTYPADIAGTFIGSVSPGQAQGSQFCAQMVKKAISSCPETKIVLAGYSQGAQQVHGCLIDLSADEAAKVAAAVTFGDPLKAQPFKNIDQSKTKIFCAAGDLVCTNQFIITPAHLSYASASTGPAAEFIQSQLGSTSSTGASSGAGASGSSSTEGGSSTGTSTGSSASSSSTGSGSGLLGGLGGSSGGSGLMSGLGGSSGGSGLMSGLSGLGGSSGGSGLMGGLGGLGGSKN